MEGVSIRVPYRHLSEAEVEMVSLQGDASSEIDLDSSRMSNGLPVSSFSPSSPSSSTGSPPEATPHVGSSSLKTLILGCTVAAGVQFGWALQLSLLTPYIQVRSLFLSRRARTHAHKIRLSLVVKLFFRSIWFMQTSTSLVEGHGNRRT